MNYASRLGLVHVMRRDPNGIRRAPYLGRAWNGAPLLGVVLVTSGIRRDLWLRNVVGHASRLGLVDSMRWDPKGIRRDPHWAVRGAAFCAWSWCLLLTGPDGIRGDAM